MRKLWPSLLLLAPLFAQDPEMIGIPAAKCTIGDSVSHEEIHKPDVAAFLLAKAPVTNAQYKIFIDETGRASPEFNSVGNKQHIWTGKTFPPEAAEQPVVNVSWNDATAYCQWLAKKTGKPYRLPSEEEWEAAARGGIKAKPYPWGDGIDQTMAWYGAKWAGAATLKPASYGKPNPYGLFGMAGNACQWIDDWYVPTYNGRPVQEELKMFKVIRGGSWANDEGFLTVSYRNFHPPDFKDFFLGFRVALSAK